MTIVVQSINDQDVTFDWGRFPDDQVRRQVKKVRPESATTQPSTTTIDLNDQSNVLTTRLNDLNGINRNFTANRGAFGFRNPRKSSPIMRPTISNDVVNLNRRNRNRRARQID
ncbi:hypothetical protein RDWZM_010546 [Blomia tropicalis]|uniref:Uncharacterized protein n=1 Tax=Blomia tropicalis TaxID=40697 RepID=A0A9Q0LZE5_BLOTA|nr:hypothetical protein BLOT_012376 [Blomia tropicalis]KAJ6216046.1 hypothetical protein RDWZM_010546 [Blomia tropicalis]